jgi:hypothetical protein
MWRGRKVDHHARAQKRIEELKSPPAETPKNQAQGM